jgi:hypothetical protein
VIQNKTNWVFSLIHSSHINNPALSNPSNNPNTIQPVTHDTPKFLPLRVLSYQPNPSSTAQVPMVAMPKSQSIPHPEAVCCIPTISMKHVQSPGAKILPEPKCHMVQSSLVQYLPQISLKDSLAQNKKGFLEIVEEQHNSQATAAVHTEHQNLQLWENVKMRKCESQA